MRAKRYPPLYWATAKDSISAARAADAFLITSDQKKGRPLGPPNNIQEQGSVQSGVTATGPQLTRAVCSEPSACLAALMPTWAPGLSSLLSPATYFLITASEPMMIFFSPSLYFTMMFCPSTPDTVVSTVALVMVLFGRVHGRWPSPLPRIGSAKMITRIAFWLPSACGVAPTPMNAPFETSDTEAFSRPHTATLLASATFCSPACVLMPRRLASAPWICPSTGTTCGCCAEAVVTANAVAMAAAVRTREIFMLFLPYRMTEL